MATTSGVNEEKIESHVLGFSDAMESTDKVKCHEFCPRRWNEVKELDSLTESEAAGI
jgi:hypothetical protein